MPFILRCPYPDCQKYMLLEDDARGSTVQCLCCKREVNVPGGPVASQSASSSK